MYHKQTNNRNNSVIRNGKMSPGLIQTFMSALRPPTPSRSDPGRLHMTLGEQKPSKMNENEGFRLQLAFCAPGLTTPGSACRKVRGSLGGFTHVPGIEQQIMTKMHRISTKYKRISSGRAERTQGDGQRQRSFTEKTNRNHA